MADSGSLKCTRAEKAGFGRRRQGQAKSQKSPRCTEQDSGEHQISEIKAYAVLGRRVETSGRDAKSDEVGRSLIGPGTFTLANAFHSRASHFPLSLSTLVDIHLRISKYISLPFPHFFAFLYSTSNTFADFEELLATLGWDIDISDLSVTSTHSNIAPPVENGYARRVLISYDISAALSSKRKGIVSCSSRRAVP